MNEVGLVVMAYGTPASPADIEAYYTHIRRGHAPTPEQLADLRARYEAIGGTSPLAERTEAQRLGLAAALHAAEPGRWTVALGQKHAAPFIEDAVATLAGSGVQQIVGLVLAPHYSRSSVGQYQERLHAAAGELGVPSAAIDSWHLEPAYVDFLRDAVRDALVELPERTEVRFTAHSLPERALVDDPYPDQLHESAAAVARAPPGSTRSPWSVGLPVGGAHRRSVARARRPRGDRRPRRLAVGPTAMLVCPQGFVSDHLEVVYDLDLEAARRAESVGLAFARTRVLNDDPTVLRALAERVRALASPS